ncbi:FRG domain-containing protein [Ralstonia holmesii]|uniref:FRG domain-containing protein n=1 Tax=Ralstonia holmesii TaxID=3058602 RepID=UPI003F18AFFA
MPNPTLIKVTSFAEYVSTISEINAVESDSAWFRGHSSATYRLVPSALRDSVPLTSAYGAKLRGNEILRATGYTVTGTSPERMLDDFKRRALPFLEYSPKNDFEWLFLMQHHGAPTRLLDWTTNALVALYFAVSSLRANSIAPTPDDPVDDESAELNEFDENSVAIFAMNPNKVNSEMHENIHEVVDIAHDFDRWKPYSRPTQLASEHFDTYPPLCITAPQLSPRIRAQSGLFSIHGTNIEPLDHYTVIRPLLTKILIPFESAIVIQKELRQFGISESFIYPGLDSVAKDVKADEERRYAWERKDYLDKLDAESMNSETASRIKKKKSSGKRKKSKSQ